MRGRIDLGRRAEELVSAYLQRDGHFILNKNWRVGHLEVDLISIDKNGLHFVEVKSVVLSKNYYNIEDKVDKRKQNNIVKAAQLFITRNKKFGAYEITFDVATVVFNKSETKIKYIKQAYIPLFI